MATTDKDDLHNYLQQGREALLWKLDGVSEYDARRPLVPTGTNLLGLVKHVAGTEAGYLGLVFGRPFPEPLPWMDDEAEDNADMWARADESREAVVDLYRRVWSHSDATISALQLDTVGTVPWWQMHREATLHRVLTHVIAETHRHAGHADLVRELVDGAAGHRLGYSNLPPADASWWRAHHDHLERVAQSKRLAGDALPHPQAPNAGGVGEPLRMSTPSTEIHGTARMVIHDGKLEEFKRLAAQCVEIVRTRDTGTVEYDLFLNADGTECFVHERYRDSAAGLEHMANIGSMMGPLSEICTTSGEICGIPSPELRESLEAAGVTIFEPLHAFGSTRP